MINPGQTLHNPVTGETLTFHETSLTTGGAYVLLEAVVTPNGAVASAHVHPRQSERFEVIEGRLGMRLGRDKLELGPGDVAIVDPGTPHRFWNAGDADVRFVTEVRPAYGFEALIETMFGLAADGKTNGKGMPNPLRLAVIAHHHFDDLRLPLVPAALQKLALATGAPLGRVLGYAAEYAPAAPALTAQPATATA